MTERNTAISRIVGWLTPSSSHDNAWFPGRVIGGMALVVGPVVWFVGLLLRYLSLHSGEFTSEQLEAFDRQPFAAPSQPAAYAENPALVTGAYTAFALGTILMCPAVATLWTSPTGCGGCPSWRPSGRAWGRSCWPSARTAGVFGPVRGLLFLLPGMGMGVLKESTLFHTASTSLVCFFLVPIGVRVLRDRLPELRSHTEVPPSWDHASPRG
ncbi:hypothetical protein JBE27_27615 [Streptomyces albiflaviniger]|nr:hypothetical protein [Streptomyces albiflaviniger]